MFKPKSYIVIDLKNDLDLGCKYFLGRKNGKKARLFYGLDRKPLVRGHVIKFIYNDLSDITMNVSFLEGLIGPDIVKLGYIGDDIFNWIWTNDMKLRKMIRMVANRVICKRSNITQDNESLQDDHIDWYSDSMIDVILNASSINILPVIHNKSNFMYQNNAYTIKNKAFTMDFCEESLDLIPKVIGLHLNDLFLYDQTIFLQGIKFNILNRVGAVKVEVFIQYCEYKNNLSTRTRHESPKTTTGLGTVGVRVPIKPRTYREYVQQLLDSGNEIDIMPHGTYKKLYSNIKVQDYIEVPIEKDDLNIDKILSRFPEGSEIV